MIAQKMVLGIHCAMCATDIMSITNTPLAITYKDCSALSSDSRTGKGACAGTVQSSRHAISL